MKTYRVTYHFAYPESDSEKLDEAYVLAKDFEAAQIKVEKHYKGDYEGAYVKKIELLDADIIV